MLRVRPHEQWVASEGLERWRKFPDTGYQASHRQGFCNYLWQDARTRLLSRASRLVRPRPTHAQSKQASPVRGVANELDEG